jgi:hypothetical protein
MDVRSEGARTQVPNPIYYFTDTELLRRPTQAFSAGQPRRR